MDLTFSVGYTYSYQSQELSLGAFNLTLRDCSLSLKRRRKSSLLKLTLAVMSILSLLGV